MIYQRLLFTLASLLLVAIASPAVLAQAITPEHQRELADVRDTIARLDLDWEADFNPIALLDRTDRLALCGTPFPEGPYPAPIHDLAAKDLPVLVDWRDNGGNWVTPVRNQGSCGSCWIFGSVAAFETFWMISSGVPGQSSLDFAEQHILSCGSTPSGCEGGQIWDSLDFMKDDGICDEACFPYQADDTVPCSSACADVNERLEWLGDWATVTNGSPYIPYITASLQDGPLVASFMVHENFYWYSSGVYSAHGSPSTGEGHAVTIMGYDDNLQAWLVKNSWGPGWGGLGGYFWIAYDNGCGFGVYTYQCLPPNSEPVLSDPTLVPAGGEVGDTFTWTVLYTDADDDAPTAPNLGLRNPVTKSWQNHAMSSTDTTYTDGALFTLAMALSDTGTYQYRFTFTNSYGQVVHFPGPPLYNFDGPVVTPVINTQPTLTTPACVPDPGPAGGLFTFSIVYTDEENDCPTLCSQVSVWSPQTDQWTDYTMSSTDSSYADGSLYSCEVLLPDVGTHRNRYLFVNEETQFISLPPDFGDYLSGPEVVPISDVPADLASLETGLLPPVPNPANPSVQLRFRLAHPANVELTLYDAAGRLVRRLHAGLRPAGESVVRWDGRASSGQPAPSGVYLARLLVTAQGVRSSYVSKLNLVR